MARRILYCTIGETPQIVTETIWALTRQRTPAWFPDEIHIVTTKRGARACYQPLLEPGDRLKSLFVGVMPTLHLYVPCSDARLINLSKNSQPSNPKGLREMFERAIADQTALDDISSESDARIMGDAIFRLMAGFVQDPESEIHLSLAGGRKTMSAHGLLAYSIFGRVHDEASHMLVSPGDFEGHRDFWYPDQGGNIPARPPATTDAPPLDPLRATITLVPTPAPLLRHQVEGASLINNLTLDQTVKLINLERQLNTRPSISLFAHTNTLVVGPITLTMTPKQFAIMRLLATAAAEAWPGVGAAGTGPTRFGWVSAASICYGRTPTRRTVAQCLVSFLDDAISVARTHKQPNADGKSLSSLQAMLRWKEPYERVQSINAWMTTEISKMRRMLSKTFGPLIAARILPKNGRSTKNDTLPNAPTKISLSPRFGMSLDNRAIKIITKENVG